MNLKCFHFFLFCFSVLTVGKAQVSFNDTLFYKSGMERPVHITNYDYVKVHFQYVNSKGDTTSSKIPLRTLRSFAVYDNESHLVYESSLPHTDLHEDLYDRAYLDSVQVAQHQLYFNPFTLVFLSFNGQYRYRFGSKMQHGFIVKSLIASPLLHPLLNELPYQRHYSLGFGYEFIPYYGTVMSLGFDFCPTIGYVQFDEPPKIQLPLSLKFDFQLNKSLSLSIEGGGGQLFENGNSSPFFRGSFGVVIHLPPRILFETAYFDEL